MRLTILIRTSLKTVYDAEVYFTMSIHKAVLKLPVFLNIVSNSGSAGGFHNLNNSWPLDCTIYEIYARFTRKKGFKIVRMMKNMSRNTGTRD